MEGAPDLDPEEGTPPEPPADEAEDEQSLESVNADVLRRSRGPAAGADGEFTPLRKGAQLRLFSDGLVCVVVGHVMKKGGQYMQTPDQTVFCFPFPMLSSCVLVESVSTVHDEQSAAVCALWAD